MSKSIQVACECWERNWSLKAISFTNQVVFSLRPEKDAYSVHAILPRPEEAVAKGYTAERDGFFRPDNSGTYKAELFRFVPFATASSGRGLSRFLVNCESRDAFPLSDIACARLRAR
jgi:hypothetical protein